MDGINDTISNRKSGATAITMVVFHPTMGHARSGATTLAIVVIHRVISTSKSSVTTGKVFYVSWSHDDANSRH
jgi:hypothetical protein